MTTEQIETLRAEAGAAGDSEMVAICDRAIDGSRHAIREVAEAIADARAMADEPCDRCRRVVCGCDALYESARDMDRL